MRVFFKKKKERKGVAIQHDLQMWRTKVNIGKNKKWRKAQIDRFSHPCFQYISFLSDGNNRTEQT